MHGGEVQVPTSVSFELDSCVVTAEGQLEVTGRWFGVRGRRFVRPSLTLAGDAGQARALAVLRHKPWAATDGEPWTAAFPLGADLTELADAELAVAPDIAVVLNGLDGAERPKRTGKGRSGANGKAVGKRRAPAARAAGASSGAGANSGAGTGAGAVAKSSGRPRTEATAPTAATAATAPSAATDAEITLLRDERDALQRALEFERGEALRLRAALDQTRDAKIEEKAALGRRDAALARLDEVTGERDGAIAARDQARAEREEVVRERDRLLADADRLRAEREEAFAARDRALERARENVDAAVEARVAELRTEVERERVRAGRMAETLRERDDARAERDKAIAGRDSALSARDDAIAARNAAIRERDAARRDLEEAVAKRVAALGDGGLARALAPPPRSREPREVWLARAKGLAPLLAILLVVFLLVHSS